MMERRRMAGQRLLTEGPNSLRSSAEINRSPPDFSARRTSMPQTAAEAAELLDSDDLFIRSLAQTFLVTRKPDAPDPEIAGKIIEAIRKSKGNDTFSLTTALEAWGSPDQLPELEKLLETKDQSIRNQLQRVIGKIGTIEAAKILAKELNDPQDRFAASVALKTMGKTAEPAVLPLLNSKDADTCLEACRILQEIGTKRSVSGLQRLTKSKNLQISITAKQALEQVRGR